MIFISAVILLSICFSVYRSVLYLGDFDDFGFCTYLRGTVLFPNIHGVQLYFTQAKNFTRLTDFVKKKQIKNTFDLRMCFSGDP